MSKEPINYLKHIADECSFIISVSSNLSKDKFLDNETLKRAIVRSLEIIGEATKKIPADFKVKWNSIQFNSMEEYGWNARPVNS
ncbi:MAG TPA: HepT-like ribonuclease domain-containing protein [Hanamia sp.]|nr:HepT-like ribonuclease domain-containing protein [Hanamia sp.]